MTAIHRGPVGASGAKPTYLALLIGEIIVLLCEELADGCLNLSVRAALGVSWTWAAAARPVLWRGVYACQLARVPMPWRQDVATMVCELYVMHTSDPHEQGAIVSVALPQLERLLLANDSAEPLGIAADLLCGRCPRLQ
jgi:hypothetical protein